MFEIVCSSAFYFKTYLWNIFSIQFNVFICKKVNWIVWKNKFSDNESIWINNDYNIDNNINTKILNLIFFVEYI